MFGPHLMIDAYSCDKKKLSDVGYISAFLDNLPEQIGMTKIFPPYCFQYHGVKPEDWGVSGIVLIAESHISIHTFPEKRYASVDIFSCKEFDMENTSDIILSKIGAKTCERNVLMRGRHFPKNLTQLNQIQTMARESSASSELDFNLKV